jgi:hypothetical protein
LGEVIDLAARRAARTEAKRAEPEKRSIVDLAGDSIDSIESDWLKMTKKNRLNDYFKASLATIIGNENDDNFMFDLNPVSRIESKIGLYPQVYAPGTLNPKQIGWIVQFFVGEERVSTPERAYETYARCFGILMYVRLKRAALEAGHII